MKTRLRNNGSVLLITIFVVALLSAITIGILQINTEEIQLMRNQIRAAEALAIAEAGLTIPSQRYELIQHGQPALRTRPLMTTHIQSLSQALCRI